MQPVFKTKVVVDRSVDGEMLRINFNVSFPALSCEFASVDVGDAMGLNRYNLTKTVFKRPIDVAFSEQSDGLLQQFFNHVLFSNPS